MIRIQKAFALFLVLTCFQVLGNERIIESMPSDLALIDISTTRESILLAENEEKDIQVRAVITYLGKNTDLAPKYKVYITFYHGGELANTHTAFELGTFWEVGETKRISAGVYEINVVDTMLKKVTYKVDTIPVFIDDKKLDVEGRQNFYFKSKIKVSHKLK